MLLQLALQLLHLSLQRLLRLQRLQNAPVGAQLLRHRRHLTGSTRAPVDDGHMKGRTSISSRIDHSLSRTSANARVLRSTRVACVVVAKLRDLAAVPDPPVEDPDVDRLAHEVARKPEVVRQPRRVDALAIACGVHDVIEVVSGKPHQIVGVAGMVSEQGADRSRCWRCSAPRSGCSPLSAKRWSRQPHNRCIRPFSECSQWRVWERDPAPRCSGSCSYPTARLRRPTLPVGRTGSAHSG